MHAFELGHIYGQGKRWT